MPQPNKGGHAKPVLKEAVSGNPGRSHMAPNQGSKSNHMDKIKFGIHTKGTKGSK
jgi:hypothetical protein